MRTITHFFIIIFVILSLFIVKDDLIIVYNNILSYIENKSDDIDLLDFKNNLKEIKLTEENVESKNTVSTPGALRVSDKVLSSISSSNLTISGIIDETNLNRVEIAGLPVLTENQKLNESAMIKLNDMFSKQYFEHVSPLGVGVDNLANDVMYEYIIVGENLALGNFKSNKSLLDAWMASPGHRANILNKQYTEIGVAVGRGNFEGKDVWIAVQHFGLPKEICPSVDSVLKGLIDIDQENINNLVQDLSFKLKSINNWEVVEGKTHREQIIEYNELVKKYNKIVSEIKIKILKYNSSVKDFNDCAKFFVGEVKTVGE